MKSNNNENDVTTALALHHMKYRENKKGGGGVTLAQAEKNLEMVKLTKFVTRKKGVLSSNDEFLEDSLKEGRRQTRLALQRISA